jgi:hypothetical protein
VGVADLEGGFEGINGRMARVGEGNEEEAHRVGQ